jgi:anti-sigma regulatory factor (Ser/Thr protein kinase)
MSQRRFGRTFRSLEGIFRFVAEFLESSGLPAPAAFELDLVIEELFTNMVKYAPHGAPEIELELKRLGPDVVVVLRDFDVEPFDPTRAPQADVGRPLDERPTGGLGLHLVRRIARDLRYDYRDRSSTVTVTVTPAPEL